MSFFMVKTIISYVTSALVMYNKYPLNTHNCVNTHFRTKDIPV